MARGELVRVELRSGDPVAGEGGRALAADGLAVAADELARALDLGAAAATPGTRSTVLTRAVSTGWRSTWLSPGVS